MLLAIPRLCTHTKKQRFKQFLSTDNWMAQAPGETKSQTHHQNVNAANALLNHKRSRPLAQLMALRTALGAKEKFWLHGNLGPDQQFESQEARHPPNETLGRNLDRDRALAAQEGSVVRIRPFCLEKALLHLVECGLGNGGAIGS